VRDFACEPRAVERSFACARCGAIARRSEKNVGGLAAILFATVQAVHALQEARRLPMELEGAGAGTFFSSGSLERLRDYEGLRTWRRRASGRGIRLRPRDRPVGPFERK
jgi:hypothetical protein